MARGMSKSGRKANRFSTKGNRRQTLSPDAPLKIKQGKK